MAKQSKRIMREFELNEISAVTAPAQKGARMLLMKRAGGEDDFDPHTFFTAEQAAKVNAAIMKRGKYKLTTPNMGHTHLVDIDDWVMMAGGGTTSCVEYAGGGAGGGSYHSHPFVIGPKGEITIGEVMGHTHEIADVPTMKAADSPALNDTSKGDEAMTPEMQKELDDLRAIAGMNDAQKAHLAKLSGDARDAFMKADSANRDNMIAKANAGDPVVYKGSDGTEYRASDGATVVALAKRLDGMATELDVTKAGKVDAEVEALVKSWAHLAHPDEVKRDWAKAIVALPEATRKSAVEAITKSQSPAAEVLFKRLGSAGAVPAGGDDANTKLQALAKKQAAEDGTDYHVAFDKVLATPAGARLYDESQGSIRMH
jgi:hypothetical protein